MTVVGGGGTSVEPARTALASPSTKPDRVFPEWPGPGSSSSALRPPAAGLLRALEVRQAENGVCVRGMNSCLPGRDFWELARGKGRVAERSGASGDRHHGACPSEGGGGVLDLPAAQQLAWPGPWGPWGDSL